MEGVQKDTASLLSLTDSAAFLSKSTETSSKLSLQFDFDDELFSSRPYKDIIKKTIKFAVRSQKQLPLHVPGGIITAVTSAATGVVARGGSIQKSGNFEEQYWLPSGKIILLGEL